MAKGEDSHTEIARVRQRDGINVIFDRSSAAASRSRSRSKSSRRSSGSGRHRGRSNRRHRRCSSSSSSSRSSSRSRSHPRCHRPSSRCRCDNHRRHGRRSAPRRHMESSDSPSPSRHSRHRRNRSRSSRSGRAVSRFSQSPPRNHRSSSGSEYSENSVDLSIDDKGNPIMSANASIIQEDEKLYSPEIVESIQSAQAVESNQVLRETWVRQDLEKTPSQSDEGELDDMFSLGMSLKRRTISFSINNAVLKPAAAAAASGAKVTSRMDSYESRKPYGHWMPVKSGHASRARRHTPAR
ncbi:arginine/serine-rich protein 1 isoform X1 [Gasterosteus aculeatus]